MLWWRRRRNQRVRRLPSPASRAAREVRASRAVLASEIRSRWRCSARAAAKAGWLYIMVSSSVIRCESQPASRLARGHPWRPRNPHPFTPDPARIGEDGSVGDRYPAGVSQREAEVLEALGAHRSNAQIAGRLHISVRTVESHVSSLLRKFGVSDRRELAELAQTVLAPAARPAGPGGLPAPW